MPWIALGIGVIAVAIVIKFYVVRRTAQLGPISEEQSARAMSGRQAGLFGLLLVLSTVLTIIFTDMSMWFIPIAIYLTVWIPQVGRRAVSPRAAIMVSTMFAIAMLVSVLVRVVVVND